MVNQPAYASLPPTQIVPRLADQGVYLASESTFYRVTRVRHFFAQLIVFERYEYSKLSLQRDF